MYTPNIATYINSTLKQRVFSDIGAQLFGVCELVEKTDGDSKRTVPLYLNIDGEGKYVGVDDSYPLTIYHRLINPIKPAPTKKGFGDNVWLKEQAQIKLVVFYPKAKYKKALEATLSTIKANFPFFITKKMKTDLRVKSVRIIPGETFSNTPRVYQDEYSAPLAGRTDLAMGALQYSVEILYDPACIRDCACT